MNFHKLMIHLLGIDHKFQFLPTLSWTEGGPMIDPIPPALFERFLLECAEKLHPDLLAEEASQPEPIDHKMSVAHLVAGKCRISHQFSDPDRHERLAMYKRAGISEEQDRLLGFPIREEFWFNRIFENAEAQAVLFICGACHIDSFSQKLQGASYVVNVIERDWSPPVEG